MTALELDLRPATARDAARVHAWANDPVTRAASFSTAEIPLADHLEWFARQLAADGHHLLIAERSGEALAFVRLDTRASAAGACTISINVAPEARGRGLGTAALDAATAHAEGLGLREIEALIRPDNGASVGAFEKAGYLRAGEVAVGDQLAVRMLRALDPS